MRGVKVSSGRVRDTVITVARERLLDPSSGKARLAFGIDAARRRRRGRPATMSVDAAMPAQLCQALQQEAPGSPPRSECR